MKVTKEFMEGVLRETEKGLWPYANRCSKCGTAFFPAVKVCNRCMCEELEEFELPKEGVLKTYTTLYRPTPHYPAPHSLCEVSFADEKLDVPGIIKVDNPEKLEKGNEFKIGSKVELITDTMWEDEETIYTGYKFKIVE